GSPTAPAMTRAVIDWFPIRIRALAMGIRQMGVPIAGALTAALLPTLTVVTGWRVAIALTGLLVLVIAIAFILLYRDAPRAVQIAPKFNLAILKTILWNRSLAITIVWGATFFGFQFVAMSYFILFLIEELDLSPIMAGGMLAIAQVGSIIGRVMWGAVSDFIFRGRRLVALAFTGFLTVLWMLVASLIDGGVPTIIIYLLAAVIGISTMSFHGVLHTFVGEQAKPGQVAVTTGVAMTSYQAGQVVMPPLFGYLVDVSSSYSLGWRVTAAMALVGTLILLTFGREPQHS
ncbi:MFS transporter, partial [Chloroflexota bacterium]